MPTEAVDFVRTICGETRLKDQTPGPEIGILKVGVLSKVGPAG